MADQAPAAASSSAPVQDAPASQDQKKSENAIVTEKILGAFLEFRNNINLLVPKESGLIDHLSLIWSTTFTDPDKTPKEELKDGQPIIKNGKLHMHFTARTQDLRTPVVRDTTFEGFAQFYKDEFPEVPTSVETEEKK